MLRAWTPFVLAIAALSLSSASASCKPTVDGTLPQSCNEAALEGDNTQLLQAALKVHHDTEATQDSLNGKLASDTSSPWDVLQFVLEFSEHWMDDLESNETVLENTFEQLAQSGEIEGNFSIVINDCHGQEVFALEGLNETNFPVHFQWLPITGDAHLGLNVSDEGWDRAPDFHEPSPNYTLEGGEEENLSSCVAELPKDTIPVFDEIDTDVDDSISDIEVCAYALKMCIDCHSALDHIFGDVTEDLMLTREEYSVTSPIVEQVYDSPGLQLLASSMQQRLNNTEHQGRDLVANSTEQRGARLLLSERISSVCTNTPNDWHDKSGVIFDCNWYSREGRCHKLGHSEALRRYGINANQACCACGGGETISVAAPKMIYEIKNSHSNRCLATADRGNGNGGRLHTIACNANDYNQQWDFQSEMGRIKNWHGHCLATDSRSAGARLTTKSCSTSGFQKWDWFEHLHKRIMLYNWDLHANSNCVKEKTDYGVELNVCNLHGAYHDYNRLEWSFKGRPEGYDRHESRSLSGGLYQWQNDDRNLQAAIAKCNSLGKNQCGGVVCVKQDCKMYNGAYYGGSSLTTMSGHYWKRQYSSYLGGHVGTDYTQRSVDGAKQRCIEHGEACGGITCNEAQTQCQVRKDLYFSASPSAEVSYIKLKASDHVAFVRKGTLTSAQSPPQEVCYNRIEVVCFGWSWFRTCFNIIRRHCTTQSAVAPAPTSRRRRRRRGWWVFR